MQIFNTSKYLLSIGMAKLSLDRVIEWFDISFQSENNSSPLTKEFHYENILFPTQHVRET